MLYKYTRYELKRRWIHPKFSMDSTVLDYKMNNGNDFIVKLKESIDISKYCSDYNIQELTIQEANDLLVSWGYNNTINEDYTVGEIIQKKDIKIWTKEQFRLLFSFEERIKFDNYEYYINSDTTLTESEKFIRVMQMKTIMQDYNSHVEFWSTNPTLSEMMLFLESIGFLEVGKTAKILN